ncbi:MAG TPA: hydrogenase accessory protein HypB [Candidatus Aerophobetes bacterium]|uniref:Hydrogenase accessory protein HypB n=1 Tax=Aerophobetes bacterium TaxID=2030807 RepID=A0A662DKN1_UNCAE|nr:MAG: hydrogenase accessory protein HypB [Candidatus Aerophobetes bacterium]HDN85570.1 hydrogenase accessory protein HypB [Candidatus Aerophobetes bacterium]
MDIIEPEEGEILDIELEEDFLEKNRQLSVKNRALLDKNKVRAIDVMGSIGSGKTSLIQLLLSILGKKFRIAVIAGDLTTSIDAERLRQPEVKIIQVNTGKECHLDARLIERALKSLPLSSIDLLFIENVGNLICPADFPLGTHQRIVVISVTEGPWMVVKHPYIFRDADIVVINKIDLAEAMQVSPEKLTQDVSSINPNAKVIPVSCRYKKGIFEVVSALELNLSNKGII